MKNTPFHASTIGKPVTKPTCTPAPTGKFSKKGDKYPEMTDWGREALRRINALRKALDGQKLA
jgi:hypothetical protein